MQNYLKKQVKKENERVKLDLSQIDFTEWINQTELEMQYDFLAKLTKQFKYNAKKILSIWSLYSWDKIWSALDTFTLPPREKVNQKWVLLDYMLFKTPNPNHKLSDFAFEDCLNDLIDCNKEKPSKSKNKKKELKTLAKYTEYLSSLSEFCTMESQRYWHEETMDIRNDYSNMFDDIWLTQQSCKVQKLSEQIMKPKKYVNEYYRSESIENEEIQVELSDHIKWTNN